MNIGNIMAPSVRQSLPLPPPTQPMTAAAAATMVQNPAAQTQTQTAVALQALSAGDAPRTGQNRRDTPEALDTRSNVNSARTAGKGGGSPRGQRVDIRV